MSVRQVYPGLHVRQLVPGLLREALVLVDLGGDGGDFLLGEVLQHVKNVPLFFVEMKIHSPVFPFFFLS